MIRANSSLSLQRSYLLAVASIVAAVLFSYGLLSHYTEQQILADDDARLSSNQRMHMQTIALLASQLALATGDEQDMLRADLSQTIRVMQAEHDQLLQKSQTQAIRAIYFEQPYVLSQQVSQFLQAAGDFSRTVNPSGTDPNYQMMLELHPTLLEGISALADEYHRASEASAFATQRVELILLIGVLLTLAAEIQWVFRPLQQRIQSNEERLEQEIARNQAIAAALRQSEKLYRLFARHMPHTSVVMFDREMRYTLAEGPFLSRFGTAYQDIVGKTVQEVLTGERLNFIVPVYQRTLAGETAEFDRETADFAYQSYASPLRDEAGTIIGGMVLTHDTTAIRRAEAALRDSEARYRALIEAMGEGVVMQDASGVITLSNPAAERILGLTADQMQGRTSVDPRWQSVHEEGSPFPGETHPAMVTLRTGQPQANVVMGVFKPDDTLTWILINSQPLQRDHETSPYGVVTTFTDITERKHLETVVRASEIRLLALMDGTSVGIMETDAQRHPIYCNARFSEITGLSRPQLMDPTYPRPFHPEDQPLVEAAQRTFTETGLPINNLEYRYLFPDGRVAWVMASYRALKDDDEISGYMVTIVDITERKRVQELLVEKEKLETALEKEQELSGLKSRMMERIGHEFRTPLTVIQTSTEILTQYGDRLSPEKRSAKARTIRDSIRRISDMLDDISIIINGSFTPEKLYRNSVHLPSLIESIQQELEARFELPGKYALNLTSDNTLSADKDVIRAALLHIMRNAARFSPPDESVTVSAQSCPDGVEIQVCNSGIGILMPEQSRIFDPFFRGSNIGELSGLGLGLTIARAGIEAHGGHLSFESVPDEQTVFRIWLPQG